MDRGAWQATAQGVAKSWMALTELLKSSNCFLPANEMAAAWGPGKLQDGGWLRGTSHVITEWELSAPFWGGRWLEIITKGQ